MITPSPTTKLAPGLARGTYAGPAPAEPGKPPTIKFAVPDTSYELYLLPASDISVAIGKRLVGTIRAQARRIDVVETGGRYVEPVFGRPRRVQGTIVRIEPDAIVVDAGVPIHCAPTDVRQMPELFHVGELVSFDVMDGATFTPAA